MNYQYEVVGQAENSIGEGLDKVLVTADTAEDMPEPEESWAAGSWLHVLEGGGTLYTLGNDRTWYQQGYSLAAVADTTEETEPEVLTDEAI